MDFERVSASAGSFLQITDFNDLLNLNSLSSSVVFQADALVDGAWVLTLGTDSNNKRWYAPYFEGSSPCQIKFRYANYSPIFVTANTNHNIATSVAGSTINGFQGYLNGAAVDTGTLDDDVNNSSSTHEPLIGALKLTDLKPFDGKIQEVIIYDSDQTNSRTAIIADQGTYYGITTT